MALRLRLYFGASTQPASGSLSPQTVEWLVGRLVETPLELQAGTEPGSGYCYLIAFFMWAGCPIARLPDLMIGWL